MSQHVLAATKHWATNIAQLGYFYHVSPNYLTFSKSEIPTLKCMHKARRAKKKAERQLAGATESDATDCEDLTKTVTQLDFDKLTVSSQLSKDSSETLRIKKAEKKTTGNQGSQPFSMYLYFNSIR